MNPEREILIKRVFPKLRKKFTHRCIDIVEIDLRWGIPKNIINQEDIILACINEVLKCKPFFISILGGRYGWVPSEYKIDIEKVHHKESVVTSVDYHMMSITEMEIRMGVFDNQDKDIYASFYLKKCDVYDDRQLALRKNIFQQEKFPKFYYSNQEEFEKQIFDTLCTYIDKKYPVSLESIPGDSDYYDHLNLLKNYSEDYVVNDESFSEILDVLKNHKYVNIFGQSGTGKTAFISYVIKHFDNDDVFFHYPTANNLSSVKTQFFKRLYTHLCLILKEELLPTDDYKIATLNLIVKLKRQFYIFIDAPELIFDGKVDSEVSALFNDHTSIVTSSTETYNALFNWNIQPLTNNIKIKIINDSLSKFGKSISQDQLSLLCSNNLFNVPLYLNITIHELRIFGNFNNLDCMISNYSNFETGEEIITSVMSRLRSDFRERKGNEKYIDEIIQLIIYSDNGLTENELMDITRLPPIYWTSIYAGMEPFLVEINGRLQIKHKLIKEQLIECSKCGNISEKKIREKIIRYMKKSNLEHAVLEICYQLYMLNKNFSLAKLLCQKKIFITVQKNNPIRLNMYFSAAMKYQKSMSKYILQILDFNNDMDVPLLLMYTTTMLESGNFWCVQTLLSNNIKILIGEDKITALSTLSRALYKMGSEHGVAAISSYESLIELICTIYPDDIIKLAAIRYKYAIALSSQGLFEKAYTQYKLALKAYEMKNIVNYDSIWTLCNYSNLTDFYGRSIEAHCSFDTALNLCKKMFGTKSTLSAWILCYKWVNDFHSMRFDDAYQSVVESNNIHLQLLGNKSMEYAWSIMNLANIEMILGLYDESEKHYLESITLNDRAVSTNERPHRYSLTPLENLVILHYLCGKDTSIEAEEIFNWKKQKTSSQTHPYMASSYQNRAVMFENGNVADIIKLYKTAENIYENADSKLDLIFTKISHSRFLYKRKFFIEAQSMMNCIEKMLNNIDTAYLWTLFANTADRYSYSINSVITCARLEKSCYVSHCNVSQMVLMSNVD